jgi:F0F1-type ATP synthase membrane subunit c/vacuolar-type H+-ATPase subunit K
MNLDDHIRAIWIAVGVLCGLGVILAFARTTVWQGRAGKDIIDLVVKENSFFVLFLLK